MKYSTYKLYLRQRGNQWFEGTHGSLILPPFEGTDGSLILPPLGGNHKIFIYSESRMKLLLFKL
jgi:hypothetical protein